MKTVLESLPVYFLWEYKFMAVPKHQKVVFSPPLPFLCLFSFCGGGGGRFSPLSSNMEILLINSSLGKSLCD